MSNFLEAKWTNKLDGSGGSSGRGWPTSDSDMNTDQAWTSKSYHASQSSTNSVLMSQQQGKFNTARFRPGPDMPAVEQVPSTSPNLNSSTTTSSNLFTTVNPTPHTQSKCEKNKLTQLVNDSDSHTALIQHNTPTYHVPVHHHGHYVRPYTPYVYTFSPYKHVQAPYQHHLLFSKYKYAPSTFGYVFPVQRIVYPLYHSWAIHRVFPYI